MIGRVPRVAFFPDSFHEVNGVAHTSRHFEQFAIDHDLPFLCIRAGNRTPAVTRQGVVWTVELPRVACSVPLERDLSFDPVYFRHIPLVDKMLEEFAPDVVHITGPSDVGLLGAHVARHYRIPLAASWHTNVHEYAGRRFARLLRVLPHTTAWGIAEGVEVCAMTIAAHFYSSARVVYAPNRELCTQLEETTGRPCLLMRRGVDCILFNPDKRRRANPDREFLLGFVGRLSVEKNVRLLVRIQHALEGLGREDFRFVIVGHGAEEKWLRQNLPRAEFTGVLQGEALAAVYADMDLFVFPSHTDTYGNVVLEALASGVPAVVTPDGGPATIVCDKKTGRVVAEELFARTISNVLDDAPMLGEMRMAARNEALRATWTSVFENVYRGYELVLGKTQEPRLMPKLR